LRELADLNLNQNHLETALPLAQRALNISRKTYGDHNPEIASDLTNLANIYFLQHDNASATPLYQQAEKLLEEFQGLEAPPTIIALDNLSRTYQVQGDYAAAFPLAKQSLSGARKNIDAAAASQSERQQIITQNLVRARLDSYVSAGVGSS